VWIAFVAEIGLREPVRVLRRMPVRDVVVVDVVAGFDDVWKATLCVDLMGTGAAGNVNGVDAWKSERRSVAERRHFILL